MLIAAALGVVTMGISVLARKPAWIKPEWMMGGMMAATGSLVGHVVSGALVGVVASEAAPTVAVRTSRA